MADVIEPLNRDYPRVIGRGDTGTRDVSFLPTFVVSRPSRLLLAAPLLFSYSILFFWGGGESLYRGSLFFFSYYYFMSFCFDGTFE